MLRPIIIHNEVDLQDLLLDILNEYSQNLEVVRVTKNVNQAIHLITHKRSDLIPLITKLGDLISIQFLDQLVDQSIKLFTSNHYRKHFLKSLKLDVIARLVKRI